MKEYLQILLEHLLIIKWYKNSNSAQFIQFSFKNRKTKYGLILFINKDSQDILCQFMVMTEID